ncbi:MAG: aminopeptidase N C-terminal domain-containing protein, partial [Acetobacteraceae bacterium]
AILLELVDAGDEETPQALIDQIASVLASCGADPAFAAEALRLPNESYLADQMKIADPDAIHRVREAVRSKVGAALKPELLAVYQRMMDAGPYRIDGTAIGRRALRNTALAYLAAADQPLGVSLAMSQLELRRNMTDVLAALAVLTAIDCPERASALASFYDGWRRDALVLDKWFAIQAVSPLPATLDSVQALTQHRDFDLKNPNRVRALIGSFSANQVRFHDASGAGYRLLADVIIRLDPLNPQVAARLVAPLGLWRRFGPSRQASMQAELHRILAVSTLSRNVHEMATRSLGV